MMTPQGRSSTGLSANVAALLAYVLSWITGLVFLLVEKESTYVRFHALQSVLLGLALLVIQAIIGLTELAALSFLVALGGFALWIFLLVAAYRGRWYRLPVIGDFAARSVGAPSE